ncbi:hypothetical protein J4233_06340 [Candidatus Pacearchaeota archaeon]|nr:hypothetical protein [Candidatus Pacearchaeota archaeon]
MRSILTILVMAALVISVVPGVFAADVGGGITPDIETEDFEPLVWLCDQRVVYDDATEPGRYSQDGEEMLERINNYAFEGEQIHWLTLVMDKNGIEKVSDVYGTLGSSQGAGNDIEVNCDRLAGVPYIREVKYFTDDGRHDGKKLPSSCNARIQEEILREFDSETMAFYECTLTVETTESMYGEYWITVEAEDLDGMQGTMDENEYWFFNPVIALSITGDMTFENVRPGTSSYSDTLLIENDADVSSGVMMDMFITGTDFYDSSSSGAKCPTSNQLELEAFRYFATNGAYSTYQDAEDDSAGSVTRDKDSEGYVNIEYGDAFNNPFPFYDDAEILQAQPVGPYWTANLLTPGADMAVTFRLDLPEPCNGDFDTGSIYFWGEAI